MIQQNWAVRIINDYLHGTYRLLTIISAESKKKLTEKVQILYSDLDNYYRTLNAGHDGTEHSTNGLDGCSADLATSGEQCLTAAESTPNAGMLLIYCL